MFDSNYNPNSPNYDARLDPKSTSFYDAAFAAKYPADPHHPNYDARLDPNSPSFDPAERDRAGLGGVGDRLGADYRNAASAAADHAKNHKHDGAPYPGTHGEPTNPNFPNRNNPNFPNRNNPNFPNDPNFPNRVEVTEKEKADLEARKSAHIKRTTGN